MIRITHCLVAMAQNYTNAKTELKVRKRNLNLAKNTTKKTRTISSFVFLFPAAQTQHK